MNEKINVTLEENDLDELLKSGLSPKEIQKEILDRTFDKISKKHKVPLKASFDEYGDIQVKIDVEKLSEKLDEEELVEISAEQQARLNAEMIKDATSSVIMGIDGIEHEFKTKSYVDKFGRITVINYVDDEEGYIKGVKAADERAEKDALKGKE